MSNNLFTKASKTQRNLRLAIYGASGSGKTYTALAIASGFGGSIALIDTENSADLYADQFDFDIAPLHEPTIENLLEYMRVAVNYKTLIIDSFSHPWRELLHEVDQIAKAKYRGNTHSAWAEGGPKQNQLVDAVLKFPGHLIVTMRSRTEWLIEKDERSGKNKPQRVGLAPVQGKDIEYEFDMLMQVTPEHYINIEKDRTGKYQDKIIEKPGVEFGKELIKWLQSAPAPPSTPTTPEPPTTNSKDGGVDDTTVDAFITEVFLADMETLWPVQSQKIIKLLAQEKLTKKEKVEILHDFGRWMTSDDADRMKKYYSFVTEGKTDNQDSAVKLAEEKLISALAKATIQLKKHITKHKLDKVGELV